MTARVFQKLPSEMIGLDPEDSYTAFCFDEVCGYVVRKLESGQEIKFLHKHASVADFFESLGV